MGSYENQFMWYELATTDVDAAIGFYSNVVGWKTEAWDGGNEPYTFWVTEKGPVGGVMILPEAAKANGAPPHWAAYVGVADVDAATDKAVGLGATAVVPPTDIPKAGRFSVIFDPQGVPICLFTPAQDEQNMCGDGSPGHFSWHELMTTDIDAAWDFYSSMFGWQKTEAMDMGEMGTYQMFSTTDGQPTGGMMKHLEEMPSRPGWLYYVTVANLDTAVSMVVASGGTVINGPIEVPGGDHIAVCRDPQGALFALHGANEAADNDSFDG